MAQKIHTFSLELTMKLMNEISKVDRFDATWTSIEKREGQTLKQLKSIATVRSVGASTRIEGSKMTDAEVEALIERLKISKLEERDEQEVAGYFETLDTISETYKDIEITEGNLKNLHKMLMIHCDKDEWHRGNYKQVSNAVEANHPDGTKHIVFQTTEPGFATEEAMSSLIRWYNSDSEINPIVKSALFVYDFLSIHPFQDGNGRLSRLLGTLLLLRHGYSWIQYVSFEHEIENRKAEYYSVLMHTQKQRPGEEVNEWVTFFLDCMYRIQEQLLNKLKTNGSSSPHAPREKNILAFIENHPGAKSGEMAEKLNIPLPTVKRILAAMVESRAVQKFGVGAGTNYTTERNSPMVTDLMFQLTNSDRKKEFLLVSSNSRVEIKKIILTPLFSWVTPEEWTRKLINNGLYLKVACHKNRGGHVENMFPLSAYNNPNNFQPVFTLRNPIILPLGADEQGHSKSDYPIKAEIELIGSAPIFEFDVMFVYDEIA